MRISDWSSDVCSSDLAVLVALPSPRNQRLGDLVAGTMVLRERTAAPAPSAVWFNPPPGLEGYASSLDVTAVADQQLAVVRSFLLRALQLSPEARYSLALRMAQSLAAVVGHPPQGVAPEPFLLCVDRKSPRLNSSHYCAP